MDSPFTTQKLAKSPYFTDREREIERVLEAIRTADRLVLYGERRMGKSSIIARAAERITAEGGVVIMADAWAVDSLDGLSRAVMASIPRAWLAGERLETLLHGLRGAVTLSVDEAGRPSLGLSMSAQASGDQGERLVRILRALDAAAARHDSPVVVVIDEFQGIEAVQEGSSALLRGAVQDTPNLSYIFAGSIVGLVLDLLGPKGPFHAMDRLEIEGIAPEHLIPWIQHRLESHGVDVGREVVERLYEISGPVTEYVIRLAKAVHRRAQPAGRADEAAVDFALNEIVADYEGSFELIWNKLSPSKRQIVRAVAHGEQELTSRDVLTRYELASSSAAQYAIDSLRSEAILAPGKPFRISDPFFAVWARGQGPG